MMKRLFLLIALAAANTFAVPTVIDSVLVLAKAIKLNSVTNQVYDFSGRVVFDMSVGSNDSLKVGLEFVPVGGGAAVTPYELSGDAPIMSVVNGVNGKNYIDFKCKITGPLAAQYTAKVTIIAEMSRTEKVADSLVGLMTLDEKIGLLAPGPEARMSNDVTRLGVPGWYMTNGSSSPCHGTSGTSSAFPTCIAMACTFDTALIYRMATAIGKEYYSKGRWVIEGPVANMTRDPRSGRGWEGLGEDPYLAGKITAAYSKGAQSVKCVVMPKHYVCNDRETNRGSYSANVSERTLREIYCMPFEYGVKEGKCWSVMTSLNLVNGVHAADNPHILTDILKTGYGFRGYTMSDWSGIENTVAAANAGQDAAMPNGSNFGAPLKDAVNAGQVSQERLSDMARRIVRTVIWAGLKGKLGLTAVTQFTADLKSKAHEQIALDVARHSIVLVKNDKFGTETTPVLPLNKNTVSLVGVTGFYADAGMLNGGGSGVNCPYYVVSFLKGIQNKIGASKVTTNWNSADVVIVCVGTRPGEGEGGDRGTPLLGPDDDGGNQLALVNQVIAANKKCIVVITGGSPSVKEAWADAPGIIVAWYPGEEGGNALADIIFGDENPSGRLSATFPASTSQLMPWGTGTITTIKYEGPDSGLGYRWCDRNNYTPLFCFGHGLSYTTFQYSNLRMSPNPGVVGEDIVVSVDIKNTGAVAGEEVPQLYIKEVAPQLPRSVKDLRGFARVSLTPGETKTVSFTLREREFAYFDTRKTSSFAPFGRFIAQPDDYVIMVGPSSGNLPLTGTLKLQSPL